MIDALEAFSNSDNSVSSSIYHQILGHNVEAHPLKIREPKHFEVPGLPRLNPSQVLNFCNEINS